MTRRQLARALGAAALLSLVAAGTAAAQTATVFVPENTLGSFGDPSVDGDQAYVTELRRTPFRKPLGSRAER
jgi:hypothetical protein